MVCHVGATLRLVDTQKDSLEMDYDQLAATINERTKAVIPVDIAGIPCDYDQVLAVVDAKRHLFRPANDLQKAIGRVAVTADQVNILPAISGKSAKLQSSFPEKVSEQKVYATEIGSGCIFA